MPATRFLKKAAKQPGIWQVFLALSFYASLHTGSADNGDFNRVMTWFTTSPATMPESWPAPDTREYHPRFFWYFIPEWKLDFPW